MAVHSAMNHAVSRTEANELLHFAVPTTSRTVSGTGFQDRF
jgi:hypothetical protein